MSPKKLAKLVLEIDSFKFKKDAPEKNCTHCNGTGIERYICAHNGNKEETDCTCQYRTLRRLEEELRQELLLSNNSLVQICRAYLRAQDHALRKLG